MEERYPLHTKLRHFKSRSALQVGWRGEAGGEMKRRRRVRERESIYELLIQSPSPSCRKFLRL